MESVGVLVFEAALSSLRALLTSTLSPLSLTACSIPCFTFCLQRARSPAASSAGVCDYLACLHVALASVFEAEGWSLHSPAAWCQPTVKEVFGNAAVLHAPHMAKPPLAPLAQERLHRRKPSTRENVVFGYMVLPLDIQDTCVESTFLAHVGGPWT